MIQFKIANVLLEDNPRSYSYPALYCRSNAPFFLSKETNAWTLYGKGEFDFTTYFNALSIRKYKKFTSVQNFHLHLEIQGSECSVIQTMADALTKHSQALSKTSIKLPELKDVYQCVDFELETPKDAVLIGFKIQTEGIVRIRNSYYYSELSENSLKDVNLVLSTTTFKKEDYITANIKSVRENILKEGSEFIDHFRMLVIDNGRTLDKEKLEDEYIKVIPNPNVGGSGGFARGMIEAQNLPFNATHILLMDDDVSVSPESIRRTYWLLRVIKPEYESSFISGAMLNYEIGEDQWEDVGYMTPDGRFSACKPGFRMVLLHDIVTSEQFVPTEEQRENMYAAWWYCVIPMSTIKEYGYPMPFFVRGDDTEYGIRCHPNFISMNGICIWHMPFTSRYSAAVERYQTTRNTLIAQATTGMAKHSDFIGELHNNLQIELKNFNYDDAELLLDGFEDFMKGPGFIGKPVEEECFLRANKNAEKLVSFEELKEQAKDIPGFDLDKINGTSVYRDKERTRGEALVDFLTFNRQRFITETTPGFAVIPSEGWMYLPGKTRGKDTLIAIDMNRRKGIIRHKDLKRFNSVMDRYNADMRKYWKNKSRLEQEYSQARSWLTSKEMWMSHFGISK